MSAAGGVVDPRREASRRLDDRFDTRVLEPSPPSLTDPPWFADDPTDRGARTGRTVVSPVENADLTWDALARGDPSLASWCADRWLGAWRRLEPIADRRAFVTTRESLHVLAEHVLARARHDVVSRIGLRFTRDGFGTPFFGDDEQVRVQGTDLVVVRDGAATVVPITTARAAANTTGQGLGAPAGVYDPTTVLSPDEPLTLDPRAARSIADWFGFGCSVLEEHRARAADAGVTRVQLWPEHFDLSLDLGDETRGTRGTFGASPGDAEHPEPYLYVTHWSTVTDDPFWNDRAFAGASLGYRELLTAGDQRGAALDFLHRGRRALGA